MEIPIEVVEKVKELNKKQIAKRLQNGRVKRKRDTANGKTLSINLVTHKYVIHFSPIMTSF